MSDGHLALIAAGVFLFLLILRKISGDSHPFRGLIVSMVFGLLILAVLNLCSPFTGTALPVSRLSLAAAAFLGLPGITAMLLLQLLL